MAADEAACASSYLWWQQRLAGSSKLWDVVQDAHSHITAQMQAQGGLMFWQQVQAEFYSPPYTVGPGHQPLCRTLHAQVPQAGGRLQWFTTMPCMADLQTTPFGSLGSASCCLHRKLSMQGARLCAAFSLPRMPSSCVLRFSPWEQPEMFLAAIQPLCAALCGPTFHLLRCFELSGGHIPLSTQHLD